jgi:hypothetical protein
MPKIIALVLLCNHVTNIYVRNLPRTQLSETTLQDLLRRLC